MAEARRRELVDLYELLEVSPHASPDVVQAAYRALVRISHPDRNATLEAERRIRQLNAAYHILSDPERRASYDLECARARRHERLSSVEVPVRPATNSGGVAVRQDQAASRGNVRVLSARAAARQLPDERLFVLSGHAIAVLAMLAVLAVILAVVVWSVLDSLANDDGPVVLQPQPANSSLLRNHAPHPQMVFDPGD